jgi:hypothetical protein
MIVDTLTDIAETIFGAVIGLGADVAVTAGRPPAPDDSECLIVNVWAARISDGNQLTDDSCQIRSRLQVSWEAWSCYNPDIPLYDPDDPQEPEDAARLYDLGEAVWCALVAAVDAGEFGACEQVTLEPAFTQPRQGGAVSMLGSLTVGFDCTATNE